MRRLRYSVAVSLDGFIAGPNGEHDWIVADPEIDFAAKWAEFDTVLMGRRTYEVAKTRRALFSGSGQKWIVASRTMTPEEDASVMVIKEGIAEALAAMKAEPGKDIWLFGGGSLLRSLLDAGLVDSVELAVIPVMLGSGVPVMQEGSRQKLKLDESKTLASGILLLNYSVLRA